MVTTHNLAFEVAPYERNIDPNTDWQRFRVGTCDGIWGCTEESYCILAITNNKKGNGHLQDVFEWFETSCRRDGKSFKILEIANDRFKKHLIEKQGFINNYKDDVEKTFN